MTEFQEYASYGAVGAVAFIIIKWVLPLFQAVINKASLESAIYSNSKDHIDRTNKQLIELRISYDELYTEFNALRVELEKERAMVRHLQRQIDELKGSK